MLPDQEVELAEIMIGGGRKPQNLAYIHRRCAYDVLAEESDGEGVDVFQVLDGVMEQTNFEDPYWELREFFRHSAKSPLTLTFQQIEEIIGDKLDWEAYFCAAFWSDEVPGMAGELWDEEYPFDVIRPAVRDFCIADACISQDYSIQRLRLLEKRAIFRKEVHGVSELRIPPALLEQKIPNDARYEVEEFLKDVVKKYGL